MRSALRGFMYWPQHFHCCSRLPCLPLKAHQRRRNLSQTWRWMNMPDMPVRVALRG